MFKIIATFIIICLVIWAAWENRSLFKKYRSQIMKGISIAILASAVALFISQI
jgi:hypothetical protein